MVQKKVPKKHPLQADHHVTKTQNQSPHQDVKTNNNNKVTTDLKKKMKKSGSIKRQEFDTTPARNIFKPPPPATTSPPPAATPNYMKPTTSSDARKEVSTKSSPHNNKKPTKTLAKTTSMKKMRSLTKTPSFKPPKKCSPVVLYQDLDAQRATCSSTLKDSKFPAYLSLNHGGTESEGTSIIKVCPYTYCSLNGHHHEPLPPLKLFLSAKRLMVKAQRSVKLGCLSPRRVKEKTVNQDELISGLIEEEKKHFFIEIYSKKNEDQGGGDLETALDEPICCEVDVKENLDQEGDVNSMDMISSQLLVEKDMKHGILVEEEIKHGILVEEDMKQGSLVEEDMKQGNLVEEDMKQGTLVEEDMKQGTLVEEDMKQGNLSELSVGNMENIQFDELIFEVSEMDFENYEYSLETGIESDLEAGNDSHIIDDEFINKTENQDTRFDEFLMDQVSQESIDEEGFNSDAFSNSDDGESIDSYDYLQSSNDTEDVKPVNQEPAIVNEAIEDEIEAVSQLNSAKKLNAKTESEDSSSLVLAIGKGKKPIEDTDESGLFNPREPNFLPVEPGPEAEKVDLKHQDLDEKKNAEEWMVDYALRQVVTKLGPARKRKVELLVEAFEKVMPTTSKCELHLTQSSVFDQTRPMQACS